MTAGVLAVVAELTAAVDVESVLQLSVVGIEPLEVHVQPRQATVTLEKIQIVVNLTLTFFIVLLFYY